MDIQPTSGSPVRPNPSPAEEMMDEFSFKPITEGLGFHHGSKKAEEAVLIARQQVADRAMPTRTANRNEHPFTTHQRTLSGPTALSSDYVQNDLALFYAPKNDFIPVAELEAKEVRIVRAAEPSVRAIAYGLDLLLIAGMTWITFAMIGFLTEIDFAASLWEGHGEMWVVVGILFAGYFLLYFTVLEKFQGGSIGKEVLELKIITADGRGPSLLRSAARAVITLLGTLSLGLTAWFDLAGSMTSTRVVRR